MQVTFDKLKAFLCQRYKHDRLYGRTAKTGWWDDYGDRVVHSALEEITRTGKGIISGHESKTGEVVVYTAKQVLEAV